MGIESNGTIQQRPWWQAIGAIAIGIFLGIGALTIIGEVARFLYILVIAISIAAALAPLINWMAKYLPRTLAIILVYFVIFLILVGLSYLIIPPLYGQLRQLVDALPGFIKQVGQAASSIPGFSQSNLINILTNSSNAIGSFLLSLPVMIFNSVVDFILLIFLSLYYLVLMPTMLGFTLSLYEKRHRSKVSEIITHMGEAMGGYLRGSTINAFILATLKYIGLLIIGVPFALVLGAFAGVMEYIPVVGAIISAGLDTLVALTVSVTLAIITLIFTVLLQQFENHVLVPLVMRSQTSIPPLIVIIAVTTGGILGGIIGAIAAVPFTAALLVVIDEAVAPTIRDWNGVETEVAMKEGDENIPDIGEKQQD